MYPLMTLMLQHRYLEQNNYNIDMLITDVYHIMW